MISLWCKCALLSFLAIHVDSSWVDPDTPLEYSTIDPLSPGDQRKYELVFSDEFEQDGRTFKNGEDPRWTAINKNDYTNEALHYYSDDNAVTNNGVLNITTEKKINVYKAFNEKTKKFYADKKHVQSAMLQSWNKFCFTGGIVEFSAKMPGNAKTGGLWPALWMLGNLARASYVGSSDYMWPYSFSKCNENGRKSQEISGCDKVNHYGLAAELGRGAPEIDLIEAMQGDAEKLPSTTIRRPYQSCSLQIAPGVEHDRPVLGLKPKEGHWYTGMEYNHKNATRSEINPFFYGVTLVHKPKAYSYQADALSANTGLTESHYKTMHKYRVEWDPPEDDGTGGHIRWYTDDNFVYSVKGADLGITGGEIPNEAMYLLMNTAVASSWGFPAPCPEGCTCECFECGNPDCACALPTNYCDNFPAGFEIDYVRVYQAVNETKHTLGCSPEKRPTATFIKGHAKRYMEQGDKRPLEPVAKGGTVCVEDADCGGDANGQCSPRGFCICNSGKTGPTCLAHAAFYENESRNDEPSSVGWSKIYLPQSLVMIISSIVLGFIFSLIGTVRDKAKSRTYQKLGAAALETNSGTDMKSYQDSTEYALPPKQKVVTYCVVDPRLVQK